MDMTIILKYKTNLKNKNSFVIEIKRKNNPIGIVAIIKGREYLVKFSIGAYFAPKNIKR